MLIISLKSSAGHEGGRYMRIIIRAGLSSPNINN